ncbi:MAG: TetR family transcriptional regulator [Bacillota bacterium]|nr:TetR family transcriptional regulator [Bacillota bacterium]
MRRTKEESAATKQALIKAAFDLFYENGIERTSLEQISRAANVTRGAVYWHFQNKNDIFAQTVREALAQIKKVSEVDIQANANLSTKEAILEMLWLPHKMAENFKFIYKTTIYLSTHSLFEELQKEIHQAKFRQYDFFVRSIAALRLENGAQSYTIANEQAALLLFSLFDGIYNGDMPNAIDSTISRELFENIIDLMILH